MKNFVFDTIERAAKTAAQVAAAAIGTAAMLGEVDWLAVGSTVAVSIILSVLTSIASRPAGDGESASLLSARSQRDIQG